MEGPRESSAVAVFAFGVFVVVVVVVTSAEDRIVMPGRSRPALLDGDAVSSAGAAR
jgi:hypothetical protein